MSIPCLMVSDWRLNQLRESQLGSSVTVDEDSDDSQPSQKFEIVFLLDVDNTLLDNDLFAAELTARLTRDFGAAECSRYWSLFARCRDELDYADYLGTLQVFRAGLDDNPELLRMSAFLLDYPFAQRLYPRAIEVIIHLQSLGLVVVLTDGDVVFQPRKVQRAGIWDAVQGRVLIHRHKERALESMQLRFPASHYVVVDDKPQLLAAMKRVLGSRLTTIFVRQGHYAAEHAADSACIQISPQPDLCIEHIGELIAFNRSNFFGAPEFETTSSDLTVFPE